MSRYLNASRAFIEDKNVQAFYGFINAGDLKNSTAFTGGKNAKVDKNVSKFLKSLNALMVKNLSKLIKSKNSNTFIEYKNYKKFINDKNGSLLNVARPGRTKKPRAPERPKLNYSDHQKDMTAKNPRACKLGSRHLLPSDKGRVTG